MATGTKTQITRQVNDYLLTWIDGFLVDRKATGANEQYTTLIRLD